MARDRRLSQAARHARSGIRAVVGLGALGGVLLVAQAYLLSRVIDDVFLGGQTLNGVVGLLAVLLGVAVLRAGAVWGAEVAARRVAGQMKQHLRTQLLAHLFALGPAYTRRERSGELTNTLTNGIEALDAYFSEYLPQITLAAALPLIILGVIFPLDLISGAVLLFTMPFIPMMMILIGLWAESRNVRQFEALSQMSAHFLDVLQGLTTLKSFGRSQAQIKTIGKISDEFRKVTLDVLRVAFLSAFFLEFIATLSVAIIAVEVGLRLLHGHLPFQEALFILILAPEFYLPLRSLGAKYHAGAAGRAAATRIFDILETPLPVQATTVAPPLPSDLRVRVQFDAVSFHYPDSETNAVQAVSFTLQPGQTTALVGASGAGKSTLAFLLMRFLEPTGGRITVDGHPLTNFDPDDWRQKIAWVPQAPYLFAASIAENIRLGNPEATLDEVIWAAEQANLHSTVTTLPEGYSTRIGERGARLSGGQAQRLAIARAFLRDAPLLILDEATSNLDPANEEHIRQALARLAQHRTVLIIAHRLSTVHQADQILLLDGGRVLERGTHQELLAQGGSYRRLVHAFGGAR
ncbi:MAG: thiol reductant ABC exporter subunit CydD [Anaerolineae bacterium]|nr:thiol reductant ABC exporter subunit CydD [Anaerolineae bacterium]